jgi:hypothetical protein
LLRRQVRRSVAGDLERLAALVETDQGVGAPVGGGA